MTINYIPNDPLARDIAEMRRHTPRPDRPGSRAGFLYSGGVPEDRYQFGTPEFLFWQCSEAALAAVETWEKIDTSLTRWAGNRRNLQLRQNAGSDLNAYYDRRSLSFFEFTTGNKTTWSGASTDVVAHEAGHACLDAARPDLWNSFYTEVGAFHEAFGDCMAILTAMDDRKSREKLLLESPWLWDSNFLEATAEDLSDGVRRELGTQHPAAAPRHALNWFNWQLPTTLPTDGPPHVLTSEIHSFGRVFSGCFYDTIGNIFGNQARHTQAALRRAAHIAGKLLAAAVRSAPETPRFFQSVGQAMILADEQQNQGANRQAIFHAFDWHNISLASDSMLVPTTMVSGTAPRFAAGAAKATISAATRKDVLQRIGARAGVRTAINRLDIAGHKVAQIVHKREIALSKLDKRLRGVVAQAAELILLGQSGRRAAVLGALPDAGTTADEVSTFVNTLLKHDCVEFKNRQAVHDGGSTPTHAIRKSGKKKILKRVRVSC